jgi:hypothetical protein
MHGCSMVWFEECGRGGREGGGGERLDPRAWQGIHVDLDRVQAGEGPGTMANDIGSLCGLLWTLNKESATSGGWGARWWQAGWCTCKAL